MKMFGPEDLDLAVYGADLVAGRTVVLSRWATVSPYASVSIHVARSHEKTAAVNLADENVLGANATLGAELRLLKARLAAEYSAARPGGLSLKVGLGT